MTNDLRSGPDHGYSGIRLGNHALPPGIFMGVSGNLKQGPLTLGRLHHSVGKFSCRTIFQTSNREEGGMYRPATDYLLILPKILKPFLKRLRILSE